LRYQGVGRSPGSLFDLGAASRISEYTIDIKPAMEHDKIPHGDVPAQ
jgi:hypothetical protein